MVKNEASEQALQPIRVCKSGLKRTQNEHMGAKKVNWYGLSSLVPVANHEPKPSLMQTTGVTL